MSTSEHTLFIFPFLFVIVYLKYSGNPRGAVQGHAEEEKNRGGGEETRETASGPVICVCSASVKHTATL